MTSRRHRKHLIYLNVDYQPSSSSVPTCGVILPFSHADHLYQLHDLRKNSRGVKVRRSCKVGDSTFMLAKNAGFPLGGWRRSWRSNDACGSLLSRSEKVTDRLNLFVSGRCLHICGMAYCDPAKCTWMLWVVDVMQTANMLLPAR